MHIIKVLAGNITEIWLGCLLFIALPLTIGLYTDYRGFLATTFLAQTIVLILFVYKESK